MQFFQYIILKICLLGRDGMFKRCLFTKKKKMPLLYIEKIRLTDCLKVSLYSCDLVGKALIGKINQ